MAGDDQDSDTEKVRRPVMMREWLIPRFFGRGSTSVATTRRIQSADGCPHLDAAPHAV